MPTEMLDSPVVPLAALFLAGQRSRGIASRQDTGGEGGVNLLAGGFADASSGWAVNQITDAVGMGGTVTPLLGRALLGAGVSRANMIPRNNAMARGVMYGVASDGVSELGMDLGSLIGDVTNGGTASAGAVSMSAGSPSSASTANMNNTRQHRNSGLTF